MYMIIRGIFTNIISFISSNKCIISSFSFFRQYCIGITMPCIKPVADPEEICLNPLSAFRFKYPMEMK